MLWKCSIIFFKNDALSNFNRFPRPIFPYINKVIEDKAKELGFTYPSGSAPDEKEIRMTRKPMKRAVPVSEEELRLKEQKQQQLEKENKDNK